MPSWSKDKFKVSPTGSFVGKVNRRKIANEYYNKKKFGAFLKYGKYINNHNTHAISNLDTTELYKRIYKTRSILLDGMIKQIIQCEIIYNEFLKSQKIQKI